MTINDIKSQLRRDEGLVLHAYEDHLGFLTIGYGRLIDKRKGGGIAEAEAGFLLDNDISIRREEFSRRWPAFAQLDVVRQGVLLNMTFQMGVDGVLKFVNTLRMVQAGDYSGAAKGMLQSKWATQTPERALRLSYQMRDGTWQ